MGLVQTNYRGTELFDLRIWYKSEDAHYPSRSGISFRKDEIEKLYRAVCKARAIIRLRKR
ncbi:PC4/YdbC family ssDNA-binding protein [Bradyrhizobium septentrionale]|uniref:PC4/YdbC family ssDNA-binding protein n=1 Tax=Bradyrhizobium septentrionale TaxID=1404411 RepID=UPI001CD21DB4